MNINKNYSVNNITIQNENQTPYNENNEIYNNVNYYPDKYGTDWLKCLGKPIKITQN